MSGIGGWAGRGCTGLVLYIIQEISGKGHGLVGATTVTKGTRILSESSLFRVPRGWSSKEQLRDPISKKVAGLLEELKPENILYTSQPDGQCQFQLGDFDSAIVLLMPRHLQVAAFTWPRRCFEKGVRQTK